MLIGYRKSLEMMQIAIEVTLPQRNLERRNKGTTAGALLSLRNCSEGVSQLCTTKIALFLGDLKWKLQEVEIGHRCRVCWILFHHQWVDLFSMEGEKIHNAKS